MYITQINISRNFKMKIFLSHTHMYKIDRRYGTDNKYVCSLYR